MSAVGALLALGAIVIFMSGFTVGWARRGQENKAIVEQRARQLAREVQAQAAASPVAAVATRLDR